MTDHDEALRQILDDLFTAGGAATQYGWDVDRQMDAIDRAADRIRTLYPLPAHTNPAGEREEA